MLKTISKKLLIILLGGFLLRIVGIAHGYPYIFNFDEPTIVRSALGINLGAEIGHFDWPHFTIYFNYAFFFIFIKLRGLFQILGLRNLLEGPFPILWNDPFIFYFITRFLNALFGTLTIIPTYLLARDMFSKRAGLLAAAVFAVIPFHVYISDIATPDTLGLFFVAWGIYFSYKFSKSLGWKDIILSAVMFGIASGVKYNAILLSVTLILFTWNQLKTSNKLNSAALGNVFVKFVVFGLVSLITLVATTHEIITDWDLFWSYEYGKGFLWQLFKNSGPLPWSEYLPALLEQIAKIFVDTGFVVLPLFVYSIFKVSQKDANKNERNLIFILSFVAIGYIMFTSRYSRATSHYFLPIYSLLVVVAAWGLNTFKNRAILYSVLVILSVLSLYRTLLFVRPDTRYIALKYYEESKENGGRTYIEGGDLDETDMINNLNMKRAKNGYELGSNDVLMTQTEVTNNDKIVLVEAINNFFRKGPIIYVYKTAL